MELQNNYQEFESRGVEILAISTDTLNDTAGIVERIGLQFPVLYNTEGDVPRAYGIFNSTATVSPQVSVLGRS